MYTSRYNWKRYETLNQFDGQKIKKIQLLFGGNRRRWNHYFQRGGGGHP